MEPTGLGQAKDRSKPISDSPTGVVTPQPPSLADAAAEALAPDGPTLDSTGAKGVPEEHKFNLQYVDSRNRLWAGAFVTKALGIRDKIRVGVLKARLSGQTPAEALDLATSNLLEMLAFTTIALQSAPDWASDLEKVKDAGVLSAIYEEVAGHEARFHGAGIGSPGKDASSQPGINDGVGVSG